MTVLERELTSDLVDNVLKYYASKNDLTNPDALMRTIAGLSIVLEKLPAESDDRQRVASQCHYMRMQLGRAHTVVTESAFGLAMIDELAIVEELLRPVTPEPRRSFYDPVTLQNRSPADATRMDSAALAGYQTSPPMDSFGEVANGAPVRVLNER